MRYARSTRGMFMFLSRKDILWSIDSFVFSFCLLLFLSVRPGWFVERKLGVAGFASTHRRFAQAAPANHAEARLGGLRADSGGSNLAHRCPHGLLSLQYSTVL